MAFVRIHCVASPTPFQNHQYSNTILGELDQRPPARDVLLAPLEDIRFVKVVPKHRLWVRVHWCDHPRKEINVLDIF